MKTTKGIVCGLAFNGSLEAFAFVHLPMLPPMGTLVGIVSPKIAYYRVINVLLVGDELTAERLAEIEAQSAEEREATSTLRDYALLFVEHFSPDTGLESGSIPIQDL